MKKFLFLIYMLAVGCSLMAQNDAEYTDGVFFVNEDWYGHQNSSVNYLSSDGEWTYNVFRKANPGRELGCTTQFGTIYGDRFYLVSKQEKDPGFGVTITGSRLAVCDAKTMKCLKEFEFIATKTVTGSLGQDSIVSIADGRSFLGVDESKGYIATNNGIYIYDMDKMEILGMIEDTGNPNDDDYGSIYHGQTGTMVRVNERVFAVNQSSGVLVIDPVTDNVITTIQAPKEYDETTKKNTQRGFGSIVLSKDGNLWISVCVDQSGSGAAIDRLYKLDPATLDTTRIELPKTWAAPNSWYAWTADGFCASAKENKLYWKNNGGWFASTKIYSYDIDNQSFSEVYDFATIGWAIYGAGFRLHPETDDIYCSLYHTFGEPTYQTARVSSSGELLNEYSMINHYWFPAMPVFPDNKAPVVKEIADIVCNTGERYVYTLADVVSDEDNMEAAIVKSVVGNTGDEIFGATVLNGYLVIEPGNNGGNGVITLRFNSNGKIVDKDVNVLIEAGNSIDKEGLLFNRITLRGNILVIENCEEFTFEIFDMSGKKLGSIVVESGLHNETLRLQQGVYIVKGSNGKKSIFSKILIR